MTDIEIRIDYFLKNLFLTYHHRGDLFYKVKKALYDNTIVVPDFSSAFFKSSQAVPQKIYYVSFLDEKIPVHFFDDMPEELYFVENGVLRFNFDIVGCVCYYLSGWQERYAIKDDLNRFVYAQSLQALNGTVFLPVVNYYYLMFVSALEHTFGYTFSPKFRPKGAFFTCITHDVDIIKNIPKMYFKIHLSRGNMVAFAKEMIDFISTEYHHSDFSYLCKILDKNHIKSTFYFLPSQKKYLSYTNADYDIEHDKMQFLLNHTLKHHEVGIHPPFGASENEQIFKDNICKMPANTIGCRFHYLMYDAMKTPGILEQNNIKYDSTLGFNDMPGFRNGCATPFYLFDFEHHTITSVIEMPLLVMDSTLFYPQYLDYKNALAAYEFIKPILLQVKKVGGILTVNFHNHIFGENVFDVWQKLFFYIIDFAKDAQSTFVSQKEIYQIVTNE